MADQIDDETPMEGVGPTAKRYFDPKAEYALVLEDSAPNRNILIRILEKIGYSVLAAENGKGGVEYLDDCVKNNLKLNLIFSDLMMPEMDGLQFLEYVKGREEFKNIPFIFLTASTDKNNIIEAKKLGVTSYLLKPVTMEKIIGKLKGLFPNKRLSVWKAS